MICLSWNCRVLGKTRVVQDLSELVKTNRLMVVLFFKTLVNSKK